MTPFNVSLAKNMSVIADQLSQAQISVFLSDPSRAVDVTPSSLRSRPCTQGANSPTRENCERTFFIPGGVEFAAPTVHSDSGSSDTEVFLVRDQQGYLLEFKEGNRTRQYNEVGSYEVYGFPFAAFHLYLKNSANNTLDARKRYLIIRIFAPCTIYLGGTSSRMSLIHIRDLP